MQLWQAHLALSSMIGDPIEVGSPVTSNTVIPDGVRYSKRLRDVYLYRAMLAIFDEVLQQTAALDTAQADQVWFNLFPTFLVEDTFAGLATNEATLTLTRKPVRIHNVYTNYDGGRDGYTFRPAPSRKTLRRKNTVNRAEHDPQYTIAAGTPAAITVNVPTGYVQTYGTQAIAGPLAIKCLYTPVPADPSTQTANQVLDFEPIQLNRVIAKANLYARADSQDMQSAEAMTLLVGGGNQ
jgi:hypothetical protein